MKNYLNKLLAKKKAKKGFTLVELLVVIAILAILATVSVVGYLGFTTDAKKSNDLTELAQYKTLVLAKVVDGSETVSVVKDGKADAIYTVEYGKNDDGEYEMKVSESDYKLVGKTGTGDAATDTKAVANTTYYAFHTKSGSVAAYYSVVEDITVGTTVVNNYYTLEDIASDTADCAAAINAIIGTDNQISGATLTVTGNVTTINYHHNYDSADATWTISTDALKQA